MSSLHEVLVLHDFMQTGAQVREELSMKEACTCRLKLNLKSKQRISEMELLLGQSLRRWLPTKESGSTSLSQTWKE